MSLVPFDRVPLSPGHFAVAYRHRPRQCDAVQRFIAAMIWLILGRTQRKAARRKHDEREVQLAFAGIERLRPAFRYSISCTNHSRCPTFVISQWRLIDLSYRLLLSPLAKQPAGGTVHA